MVRRIIGIVIVILAIGIALVPQATKCHLSTMPCNYTAKAELALSLPILIEGLFLVFSRERSQSGLALVGAGLGVSVILVVYVLIGVCGTVGVMQCITIMKPALLVMGLALIAVNLGLFWSSMSKKS